MGIVLFDAAAFRMRYPEMDQAADGQMEMWFTQAESIVNNTECSIVTNLKEREMLLMLLMRHFAALDERAAQSGLVGRISSATEGSVSVGAAMGGVSGNAARYMQTPWGASYWQLTTKYRRFRYVPWGCHARRR